MTENINGLYKLREELHNKILRSRSIEAMVVRPQFERLWGDSTEDQKAQARALIEEANKDELIKWMRDHPSLDIGEKPMRDLIPIARRLCIKNYSRLSRSQLLIEIQRVEAQNGV